MSRDQKPASTNTEQSDATYVNERPNADLLEQVGRLKKGAAPSESWLHRFWKATTTPYIPALEINHGFDLQLDLSKKTPSA